ncbi:MAG: N-acetylmuramoyl-L-alanine amidase [Phocaeicola sp.]
MKILIDNGHGENTPGKRSPDGKFREYLYCREIADKVVNTLISRGYDAERIVKEFMDVPLAERSRRVNEICGKVGASNVILVSIHCNAAGNGKQWMDGRGWAVYTSKGKTKSDVLAEFLYDEAEKNFVGQRIRVDKSDGDRDWEENFHVLAKTKCPAVLTENFFMDNKDDLAYLVSPEGREAVVATHVDAIIKYIKSNE